MWHSILAIKVATDFKYLWHPLTIVTFYPPLEQFFWLLRSNIKNINREVTIDLPAIWMSVNDVIQTQKCKISKIIEQIVNHLTEWTVIKNKKIKQDSKRNVEQCRKWKKLWLVSLGRIDQVLSKGAVKSLRLVCMYEESRL